MRDDYEAPIARNTLMLWKTYEFMRGNQLDRFESLKEGIASL